MQAEMMNMPLIVSSILRHAETVYGGNEIVSRLPEGGIWRYTYAEAASRSRRLANALIRLGVRHQDRVGTLAWNTHRHYELYYAVSGSGAIIHTVNPRLFPEQVVYILNHAGDEVLFFDITFLPLVEKVAPELTTVKHFVALAPRAAMPQSTLPLLCYEDLIAAESDSFDWPVLHEGLASALCYTSGTTGNPKGVLFGHRSTVLHAYASMSIDALGVSNQGAVLPVVPMFHVNAWGIPYSATMAGSKLVLPAGALDGASLYQLMMQEKVTSFARRANGLARPLALLRKGKPEARIHGTHGDRRLGGSGIDDPPVPGEARCVRDPRLGHDRDVAAWHDQQHERAYGEPDAGGAL